MTALRWIVGAVLFVGLLLFSLQNAEPVTLRLYHWWSWQAPLIFVLLLVFALGAAAGLLAGVVRSARLKRTLNRLRKTRNRRAASASTRDEAPRLRAENAASAVGLPQGGPADSV